MKVIERAYIHAIHLPEIPRTKTIDVAEPVLFLDLQHWTPASIYWHSQILHLQN